MIRALIFAVSAFLPASLSAQCIGVDLIQDLPVEDRAELDQVVADMPYPRGLLWQASKGDQEITIFGTYHFAHEQTLAHLEVLKPMIEAADAVYLEISNDDQAQLQAEMAEDPSIMFITEGPTLPDLLGDEDWDKLAAEMSARNIPPFMAAKFKPIWASMMLGIGPCEARNGAMESQGIDKLVGDYAAEVGKPSQSLEDFRTLLTMLDSLPQEDQLNMIRLFFDLPLKADDLSYTLKQKYLEQEVALIWEYTRDVSVKYGGETAEADFDLLEQQMLVERNADWIEVLTDPKQPDDLFVAFGAGHLPGEIGVLYLLEQEGYEIERLEFTP